MGQRKEAEAVEDYGVRAKQARIANALRARIVSGRLPAGGRVPTHLQLAAEFKTTPLTVQRVLDRLSYEGWVVSQARRGTFVVDRPPHLDSYALVLGEPAGDPSHPHRSTFHEILIEEAMRSSRSDRRRRFSVYAGIDPHVDTEDFRRLEADVRTHRLAGLILLDPYRSQETPLLMESTIARVGIFDTANVPGVPAVNPDKQAWLEMAFGYLASRGRRRSAVLTLPQLGGSYSESIVSIALSRGLEIRPETMIGLDPVYPIWARNAIKMIFRPESGIDALVITDDHLVEQATGAMAELGLRVPQDVDIVAHANFPRPTPAVLPATRLGMDAREILEVCVGLIEAQNRGEKVAELTPLCPVFEEQLLQSPRR